jgi:hypothetical protein
MLTPQETVRLRRIKDMALRGLANEVSRADKQWALDIAARENQRVPFKAAVAAYKEGYDISRVSTTGWETVVV